jgi:hypothetical protein
MNSTITRIPSKPEVAGVPSTACSRSRGLAAFLWLALLASASAADQANQSLLQLDPRALVSRSDLIYLRPASGPGEGQPIGNGVMATLVWTTPDGVHFLINRTDVMGADNTSENQFGGETDEFGSVAWVSVRVGGGQSLLRFRQGAFHHADDVLGRRLAEHANFAAADIVDGADGAPRRHDAMPPPVTALYQLPFQHQLINGRPERHAAHAQFSAKLVLAGQMASPASGGQALAEDARGLRRQRNALWNGRHGREG